MARKKNCVKSETNADETLREKEMQQIIEHFNRETAIIIKNLKENTRRVVDSLKAEMHKTIAMIPKDMTVGEYIAQYMNEVNDGEDESAQTMEVCKGTDVVFSDITNKAKSAPNPSCGIIEETVIQTNEDIPEKTPRTRGRAKSSKKKPPSTARTTRKKKTTLQTPTSKTSFHHMKMLEGTPLLSKKDTSHLNLTKFKETPREMRDDDGISAFHLTMFSERGSPIVANTMSLAMQRKVQESLKLLMQEEMTIK